MGNEIEIRECVTFDDLAECVDLQREVFALPDIEISPVRHLIVTKNAGGFALGAYDGDRLAGFVLSVPAFLQGERALYSHMTGVRAEYQSLGVGSRLKWAQRTRALEMGVKFIKWTFEPIKARNAYFNLEKLGAVILELQADFYGHEQVTSRKTGETVALVSDRLFAEWHLESEKVEALAAGEDYDEAGSPEAEIVVMSDWHAMVQQDAEAARDEQMRIRGEFQAAFAAGLIGRGFRRDETAPAYLLYRT